MKWISFKTTKPPEDMKAYLVTDGVIISVLEYSSGKFIPAFSIVHPPLSHKITYHFTHWMELPELPSKRIPKTFKLEGGILLGRKEKNEVD